MSRPNVGWLRVAAFPERVQRMDSRGVTAVLPVPPRNGQYPAWIYILCSFLVVLDYLIVVAVTLALAFVLSVNGVTLPADQAGGMLAVGGLAAAVHAADAVLSRGQSSPLDDTVRRLVSPAMDLIGARLVTFERVSPQAVAATTRPTPVAGVSDQPEATDRPEVTQWDSMGSFPLEDHDRSDLPFSEGDRFQSFDLVSQVGHGALSRVWQAEDSNTGETVALKVFDPIVGEDSRRRYEADFLHEAKVLRHLSDHEHIVSLLDSGYEPYPWIALEYVEAGTLRDQLPVSLPTALTVLLAATEAIEYAHAQGISHTDLKPENVLYSEEYFGRLVLVTDWGKRPIVNPDLEPMFSRPYAAPEQFDALPTNESEAERIDIYQLGMVGYELFTGTQPFLTTGEEDTEYLVQNEVPPPPSDQVSAIPASLDEVILTSITKQPEGRYQTIAEFRSELLDVMLPDVTPGE